MSGSPGRAERQALDRRYYDDLWGERLRDAAMTVPPDDELAKQNLGRLLVHMWSCLGDLAGVRVLELGCGGGDYTVMLARRGALVTAIDVSAQAGRLTHLRAKANEVDGRVRLCQMAGERLAFRDGTFDLVVGFGILHHLDLQAAAPEIRRVLKSEGRAVFREPLGENAFLEFARGHLPYRGKARSPNEMPLTYEMIATSGRWFRDVQVREMYLLSMIGRVSGHELSWTWLWRFDEWLMRRVPALRRFCRYAVIAYYA